jgi:O-acetyl-ADP-ribose deacetylase (regulator of RNase III)
MIKTRRIAGKNGERSLSPQFVKLQYNYSMSELKKTILLPNQRSFEIRQGDLTEEEVDGIVNAANANLMHGGGVAAAIVRAGGMSIQAESTAWVLRHGPVSCAEPAFTRGYKLPARFVIHAVGPVWGEGDEDHKLAQAIGGSLQRASGLGLHSLAFPAISTGIFGFPKARAARIFYESIVAYFHAQPESSVLLVRLVLWSDDDVAIFLAEAEEVFGA